MKAVFKVKTLDKDTRIEYPASSVAIEVSDAFASRLMAVDPNGNIAQFEDVEYDTAEIVQVQKVVETADNSELLAEIEKLKNEKEELTAEKLTVDNQLIEANDKIAGFEIKLKDADDYIIELNQTIEKLSAAPKEEAKETLFDKPKDKK